MSVEGGGALSGGSGETQEPVLAGSGQRGSNISVPGINTENDAMRIQPASVKGEVQSSAPSPRPLSPSSLNDLLVCERRWAFSHGIDPTVEKAPPNKYLVLGQAVHQAIRWDYEGKNPYAGIEEAVAEQVEVGGDPELALLHGESMYQAFRLWKREHPEKPLSQEGEVSFMVGDYPVVGFVDAMFEGVGRDWKTASKAWDFKKQKDAWLQATAYAIGTGQRSWEFVVFYPSKEGASYGVHPVLVSDMDVRRFEAMVRAFGPLVQKTAIEEFPIRPGSSNWLCSEKWCSFWQVCPGGEMTSEEAI